MLSRRVERITRKRGELDALCDRFLLRSSVEQVSSTALRDLLKLSEASETKARADINDEQKFSLKASDFQGVKEKRANQLRCQIL